MIDRIVITGDVRRPAPQRSNIEFLFGLIRKQVEWITGIIPECHSTYANEKELETLTEWIDFERPIPIKDKRYYLWDKFGESKTLYIGFEMSSTAVYQASQLGIKLINICIHPVRFMDDLVFALKITGSDIDSEFLVSNEQMEIEASMMQSAMACVPGISCDDGSILIIGQTPYDRAVIENGSVRSLYNYQEEIRKIVSLYKRVMYKSHPSNKNDSDLIFTNGFGLFRNVIFASEINIYRLLSEPHIHAVCGLSSSVLDEAKFFNKKVHRLMKKNWSDGYAPISARTFLGMDFWKYLLSKCCDVKTNYPKVEVPHYHSMMRKTVRTWWGYDILK
jgi:hypothetical protein